MFPIPNIRFTCEIEENSQLSFLDANILKENGKLTSTTYRKPTFTGLGTNFLSFSPYLYKVNSIMTLINRAYNICSNFELFDLEIKYLQNFFSCNSFPSDVFFKCLKKVLKQQN